jgi:hypothetical protein
VNREITVRDALIRDLELAFADLASANRSYADVERDLQRLQTRSGHAFERKEKSQRNVDRLKKALEIIEGEDI